MTDRKVCIGVPNVGTIRSKTVLSLLGAVFASPYPTHFVEQQGCYVQENRYQIVREAQRAGCTDLFFVDADMVFPTDTLLRLLALERPIVGVYYNQRGLPLVNTVKIADADGALLEVTPEDMPRSLFSCYAVGSGCMLVRMEVFERLAHPWFFVSHHEDGSLQMGDDVWFGRQARAAGVAVWCDPTIGPVHHLGDYAY